MVLRLTAILPNYNHAQYLPAALESVLSQKRPPDELIIVDDHSSDDSVDIIEAYLPRLPNARLIRNRENIGAVAILNREIANCSSDIVVSVNADDIIYPKLFAVGMSLFEEYPEAGVFSAGAEYLSRDGKRLGPIPLPPIYHPAPFISPKEATTLLMRDYSWFFGPTSLYRRAPLLAVGGFLRQLHSFNDLYAAQYLAVHYGALFAGEILAGWRRIPGGMAWRDTTRLDDAISAIQRVGNQLERDHDLFPRGYARRWVGRYSYAARSLDRAARRKSSIPRQRPLATVLDPIENFVDFWMLRPWDFPIAAMRLFGRLRSHREPTTRSRKRVEDRSVPSTS